MLIITGNGRLTHDPKLKQTSTEKSVVGLRIASDRRKRDADPLYLTVVLWEKAAEIAAEHLVKGQQITFTGRLETRSYSRGDGSEGWTVEVHGADVEYGAKPRPAASEEIDYLYEPIEEF